MTFPVLIESDNGHFTASLVGEPEVRAQSTTRSGALADLQAELARRVERGDLITLSVPRLGVSGLAGKYADDPTLAEICAEAYAERDRDAASLGEPMA